MYGLQIDKKTMRYLFLCVLGGILLYWLIMDTQRVKTLISSIWNLVAPFAVGTTIAFIFNVPMRTVEREIDFIKNQSLRRTVSIFITLFLFATVIALVIFLLVPQITMTARSIMERLPEFVMGEVNKLMTFLDENPQLRNWVIEYTNLENIDWPSLVQKVIAFISERISKVFNGAFSAIGSVTSSIFNAFLSIVFAFYVLSRKEILSRQGRRLMYAFFSEKTADQVIRITRLTNTTFSNFISGQCLEAVILGALFAIAMAILKLPYIALVSVIISVTALIPLVGAFIGCALGCFFILVESPMQALTFLVLFLVLQQVEGNMIYPRVVGTSIGLPGMWVLVAFSIGGELFGIPGMLVMIPLASVLYALLGEYTYARLEKRNIPDYKLVDHPPELRSRFKENRERKQRQKLLKKMKDFTQKRK